ncbi:uncharacterized protein LOC116418321 [Nasonia vitripennis]|uniref:Double jelly roll-like domain-containing protein n=1 Tax=Nasonia vitripennis TaxID=7425 RepID=A0A7M7QQ87_NASVI|nr:uncharacterized protein LOC116418321 [Nasonia vitripennis]
MESVLNVQSPVIFDESVSHYEVHAHQPYTSLAFNNSDEIRIAIQHQDLCVLPSKSSLHICGKITRQDGQAVQHTLFVNNAISHLFEEIRYEMNVIEIDRCKNVAATTLMKGYTSFSPSQLKYLENSGWTPITDVGNIADNNGNFDVTVPLSMIFGFAEDYRKIVVNVKHELILTRSRNDLNTVLQEALMVDGGPTYEEFKIEINRIEWLIPYLMLSDRRKIQLFNYIQKDIPNSMSFRSWELYEYPVLPTTTQHVWTVKTSNQLEKPLFIILGFQTGRKGVRRQNASHFDHCNISNVKLFLNSQSYPYGNLNLDILNNQFAMLYDMYANFQNAYYSDRIVIDPFLSKEEFITNAPLIVIDCSKQNESLKQTAVDVRLEFECKRNIPVDTTAYCLILHDRIVKYNPISGDIKKLV